MKTILLLCLLGWLAAAYGCPDNWAPTKVDPSCDYVLAPHRRGRPNLRHFPCLDSAKDCAHGFQCCFTLPGHGCHSMCYNAATGEGGHQRGV
ncbi:hypothetical protein V1264_008822 [Littorina saxatilis]|uniref:WAP domain-containing protein n=1 Tax=Littorina saxatilis TaxID=31220 RepID=A0AAN9AQA9_9CAEN